MERKNSENESPSDVFRFAAITLAVLLPIRYFIAQPFIVSGNSMAPSFRNGDYLVVDQVSYAFEKPKRDDVIIFKYPKDTSRYYIKRIIGMPGDIVNSSTGKVVNGETNGAEALGADEYFVMGDNRAASSDSRSWGPLSDRFIVGRAFLRLYPLNKIDIWPEQ